MALRIKQPTGDLLNCDIRDFEFIINEKSKTLEFYDQKFEKQVFEIYEYENGKKLYFKK